MNHIIKFFVIAVAIVIAIPSFAVSQQEMEQARTLAAKHYLRYANNGSDYLDKINPATMAELTKALKSKEQENIKAFNAVAVPTDYASWDKAKLVEYWGTTFFKSPGLNEDGKRCLSFLVKDLNKISVNPASTAQSQPEQGRDAINSVPVGSESADKAPVSSESVGNPSDADQSQRAADLAAAEAQAAAEAADEEGAVEERPQRSSGTIWYVAILIILIGVVIWLVMYAQKSMKESGRIIADHKDVEKEVREAKRAAKEEINKMREQYAASISAKNAEIKQLRERCEALEDELEKAVNNAQCTMHNAQSSATSKPITDNRKPATDNRQPATDNRQPATDNRQPATGNRQPATDNRQPATDNRQPKNSLPPVVFLGYVNQRGLFVKASRSLNADSSVYRMDIPDGTNGSFRVVNDPSILDRLLGDPALWLEGGCSIENPDDADIATEIVTLTPGEARFADNTCKVLKKARIKFI